MNVPSTISPISPPDLDLSWNPADPALCENLFRSRLAELKDPDGGERGLRIELLTQIARAEGAQGRPLEAAAGIETAKALGESAPDLPVRVRIRLLLEEGRLFALQRTPSRARTRFAKAWEIAVNAGEEFFIVEIARAMAEIEPVKMQEAWIRKAIEVAEKSTLEKTRYWLGDLYEDLGWRLFDLRLFEASLAAHQRSLDGYQRRDLPAGGFRARWAVGRLLRQLRRFPEALAWNQELLREMSGEGPLYGRLCEEIAECLLSLNGPEAARAQFARAYLELSQMTVRDRHPLCLKRLKQLAKLA